MSSADLDCAWMREGGRCWRGSTSEIKGVAAARGRKARGGGLGGGCLGFWFVGFAEHRERERESWELTGLSGSWFCAVQVGKKRMMKKEAWWQLLEEKKRGERLKCGCGFN